MTEPILDVGVPAPPPEAPRKSRLPLLVAAVAVAALLVGSGAAVAALYLLDWRPPAVRQYTVIVFMKPDATADQTAAVRGALRRVPNGGDLILNSKAENLAMVRDKLKDTGADLDRLTEANASESFELSVRTNRFTCEGVTGLRKMPGVRDAGVEKAATDIEPTAAMFCL